MSAKKRNAFFYFMRERKPQLEAQGIRFPSGLQDVAAYVSDEWKNMSPEQKKLYDYDKKMEPKNPDDPPKFANPTEKMRWEDKKKKELEQTLAAEIGTLVKNQKDQIEHKRFVIIDFNFWGMDNERIYVPAEIGLVAFSMSEGVIDNYGNLIDPRKIDLGMGMDVLRSADEYDLPHPPFDYDEEGQNVKHLLNCMFQFTNKYVDEMCPGQLFCRRESTDIVNGCLNWLCKETGLSHQFKLYPLEHLVIKLGKLAEGNLEDDDTTDPGLTVAASSVTRAGPTPSAPREKSLSFKFYKEIPPRSFEEIRQEKWKKVQHDVDEEITLTEEERARYRKCMEGPVVDPLTEVRTLLSSVSLYGIKHLACFHHMRNSDFGHKCALSLANGYAYHILGHLLPKFGIPKRQSAHYPDVNHAEHEMNVHTEMLKTWGLESKTYPSYVDLETRREMQKANMMMVESRSEMSDFRLEDLPLSMVPPLFRPRPPSPKYRLIRSITVKKDKKKK